MIKQSEGLAARARMVMQASVAESSHLSYSVGWRQWIDFAERCDESHFPEVSNPWYGLMVAG